MPDIDSTNLYRCTPRKARKFAIEVMAAGLTPFLQSSPGMGKSAILRDIAKQANLRLIDHRVATSAPEDFTGLPEFYTDPQGVRKARFVPFGDLFPLATDPLPKDADGRDYDGWMLFLDEFNQAEKDVQAAAYKLVLDHAVGQHMMHSRCAKAMAGNLATDRAITNELSTAMQSRIIHIELELSHQEWLEDVALRQNYDERIIAYLNYRDSELMDFKPDHNEKTFNCPRTWEFMDRLVKPKREVTNDDTPLFAGTITSGSAASFVQFCKVYRDLIDIQAVMNDPLRAEVPQGAERRWATISHLMLKVDKSTFSQVCQYIDRFDLSFRVLFFRGVLVQKPELRQHPQFAPSMAAVSQYLHGTPNNPTGPRTV